MWDAVEFSKNSSRKLGKCRHFKAFAKMKRSFRGSKYIFKPSPGFALISSTIFDWLLNKIAPHCLVNAARLHMDYQTKKTKRLHVR